MMQAAAVTTAGCPAAFYTVSGAALRPTPTAAAESSPKPITDEEAATMFRAVLNLFRLRDITDEEAATFLDQPARTCRRWKAGDLGRRDRDSKARLSNLMGLHKALRIIFREPQRGYAWIQAPNKAFRSRTALDVMLGGELTDLMRVRRYLDVERGA